MMAKLGDVCKVISGSTPKTNMNEYWDGDIKWITPAELSDDSFYIFDSSRHITEEGKRKTGLHPFPAGTVILSSRAPIGKTAIAGCKMCCNQGFKNLICSDRVFNEYLYFFLKGNTDCLNSLGRGATFKEISKGIVENIEIPLPPLDEQKRIAAAFRKIINLISLRKQQLAKLEDLIKSRFVEIFGTVNNNQFDYPVVQLGDYARLQGGYAFMSKAFVDEGVPLVQIGNVNKDFINWDVVNSVPQEYLTKYQEFALQDGDLVMAMTRPIIKSLNSVKIAKVSSRDLPCLLNQRVGRFQMKRGITPIFLEVLCRTDDFKDYVDRMSGNSLQPNVSSAQIEDYMIILPPLGLQEQFSDFVKQIDKSKLEIQMSLEKLETLKKALMQQYFG